MRGTASVGLWVTARPVGSASALALGVLTLVGACRQVLGVETRTEGPPLISLTATCDACVAETCGEAERACAAEPECVELIRCMADAKVDNPIGRVACAGAHPEGLVLASFEAFDLCLRAPCQGDCFGAKGFFDAHPPDCSSCMNVECLDEMSSCVADAQCERSAVGAIGDPKRINPAGMEPLTGGLRERVAELELASCLGATNSGEGASCRAQCGFDGRNLGCVSQWRLSEPVSEAAHVEWGAILSTPGSPEPVPDARVEFCGGTSSALPCEPIATWSTDAAGYASGELLLEPLVGFRGYIQVTEGPQSPPIYPSNTFLGLPLVHDFRGAVPVFTRTSVESFATAFTGAPLRPDRSVLVLAFLDCANRFAPGITAELPSGVLAGSTTVYVEGGTETGGSGIVTFWNVNPGCYDVRGTSDGIDTTHRMRVNVAAGVATWAYMNPVNDSPGDVIHPCAPDFDL